MTLPVQIVSTLLIMTAIWMMNMAYQVKFKNKMPFGVKARLNITDEKSFKAGYSLYYLLYGLMLLIYVILFLMFPEHSDSIVYLVLCMAGLVVYRARIENKYAEKKQ